MLYYEVDFSLKNHLDFHQDLMIAELSEAGFDTFEETESGFKAYAQEQNFNENELNRVIKSFDGSFKIDYTISPVEQKNWNEVWESNFSPITISDKCYVRATFHVAKPEFAYEIVIDPKMAFGTGHHPTTAMMMEYLLEQNFVGKSVLDMGCGTGILAILTEKLGSGEITAIDYDPLCFSSTVENAVLNDTKNFTAICGSVEAIPLKAFDVILANINRNTLLEQLSEYSKKLKSGGDLFLSGFYEADLEAIIEVAENNGFEFNSNKKTDNWVATKFIKRI